MDPTTEPESSSQYRRVTRWAGVAVLAAAGLLALGLLTAQVALAYPVSSDDATGVLEAASVVRGNPLLKGWTVSNISFWTTDLPLYVAGVALKGLDPALLHRFPPPFMRSASGSRSFWPRMAIAGRRSRRRR